MALFDWNRDGKKDWQDDYIEYQVYKDMTDQNKQSEQQSPSGSGGGSGGGMSSFGALVSTVGGLLLFVIMFILFGGNAEDMENMPVFLIIVLWALGSGGVAYFVGKLGS